MRKFILTGIVSLLFISINNVFSNCYPCVTCQGMGTVACYACDGAGFMEKECSHCGGDGYTKINDVSPDKDHPGWSNLTPRRDPLTHEEIKTKCTFCHGKGYLREKCIICDGRGQQLCPLCHGSKQTCY